MVAKTKNNFFHLHISSYFAGWNKFHPNIFFQQQVIRPIQNAYREMKAKGFRAYDNGCFNWRVTWNFNTPTFTAFTGSMRAKHNIAINNHSFGFAVDINPAFNPYVKGTSSSVWNNAPSYYKIDGEIVGIHVYNKNHLQRRKSIHYQPRQFSKFHQYIYRFIWKKYGFYWGGDYKNIKDYMHFEYVDGSLVAGKKY